MDYESSAGYRLEQQRYGEKFIRKLKKAYHQRNILPLCQDRCHGQNAPRILEFGPGLGILTGLLLQAFPDAQYHAIDIDPEILKRLDSNHPTINTHCIERYKDYQETDFDPFDIIVAVDVWEHLPPSELVDYTRRSLALLKPGGRFIAQVPNWGCPSCPNTIFAGDLTHTNRFNEVSARQLLILAGAEESCCRMLPYCFPTTFLGYIRTCFRAIFFLLYRLNLFILGLQQLRILTPNLMMVYTRKNNPID